MQKLMNPTLKILMLTNRPLQNLCFLKAVHIKSEWDLSQNVDKWRMIKTKHPYLTSGAYFRFPNLRNLKYYKCSYMSSDNTFYDLNHKHIEHLITCNISFVIRAGKVASKFKHQVFHHIHNS
jgi:hypothetical protein